MQKISAFLLFAALSTLAAAQDHKVTLHVGDPAPPIKVAKWAKGQPVTELGHGRITVVEFWATWCPPCRESIPHLTELARKFEGKATFVGVDSFEHEPDPATCYPKVEKFVADMGEKMTYNVAIDDVGGTMGRTWMDAAGQDGIPTAFVVDRAGKIAWIGHPMGGLDQVVDKMVSGTFDVRAEAENQRVAQAAAEKQQAEQLKIRAQLLELLKPTLEAMKAKKYPQVVASIDQSMDKVVALQPQLKTQLILLRLQALSQYDQAGAEKYVRELADGPFAGNSDALNAVAWTIVEENSPIKHLNPAVALHVAKLAAVASHYDPNVADTLALAFFRAGMAPDAYSTQKAAVDRAAATKGFDAATLEEMKGRLKMYEKAGKPASG